MAEGSRYRLVGDVIRENIEEAVRLVCKYNYRTSDSVWSMDVYEFFRDLKRSIGIQNQEVANLKKWKKK